MLFHARNGTGQTVPVERIRGRGGGAVATLVVCFPTWVCQEKFWKTHQILSIDPGKKDKPGERRSPKKNLEDNPISSLIAVGFKCCQFRRRIIQRLLDRI